MQQRLIASYGRRHGRRLRETKQTLIDTLLPQLAIQLPAEGALDIAALLPSKKSLWLEIGFGGGEHLAHMAGFYPDTGFIGCETYVDGVASLLSHIEKGALTNIRIYEHDARQLMAQLPSATLDKVFILYPDPWPKNRHHKRRIISSEFLNDLARIMRPGAELRLATDYAEYATWMLERILPHEAFAWGAESCDDWLKPWGDWISTRYEQKALAGMPTYLTFKRK